MSRLLLIPLFLVIFLVVANIVSFSLLALTYNNLSDETLVAKVYFLKDNKSDDSYTAILEDKQANNIGKYEIYGDQWRIDVSFIKIKYLANVFGLKSNCSLDRIEGRYNSIKKQNNKKTVSYSIEGINLTKYFNWFIDITYGSSVYQEIKLHTVYFVYKTPTGLLVRGEK
ncbi:hypothetical protein [Arcobacter caeni]|uniref:Uncharacterized protein n=1 Tax=Arcobacter caeni TaxID=1912877 RepID=A0A363CW65_9BACT|nr:hypothetical protein [Arcobacter caeni]PUE63338.1 hypothetical protein B0174_11850 [Arcobacter caeni]